MEIRRHCNERLPGGERLWRKAARIAGFNGTLSVVGLGQRRWNYSQIISRNRAKYGVTVALYNSPNRITVFVDTSPCARAYRAKKVKLNSLADFCHELGHYRQFIKGELAEKKPATLKEWRTNANERGADAYARWLLGKIREN